LARSGRRDGQFYLLPFKDKVQPCIGYKGYNTIGARGRITIGGEVVREGDLFEYELGTRAYIRPPAQARHTGRITAAWASAVPADRPPTCVVMGRAEIDFVMTARQQCASKGDAVDRPADRVPRHGGPRPPSAAWHAAALNRVSARRTNG